MLGPSHAAIGACAALAAAHVVGADTAIAHGLGAPAPVAGLAAAAIVAPIGAIAALLPDLDEPGSTLGKLLPRWWHRLTPGHRRSTHSLLAVALVGLLVHFVVTRFGFGGLTVTVLVVVGMLSHLAADGITDHGVPLLWPWRQHFGLPLFRTGTWPEHAVVSLAVMGAAWWLLGIGELLGRVGA